MEDKLLQVIDEFVQTECTAKIEQLGISDNKNLLIDFMDIVSYDSTFADGLLDHFNDTYSKLSACAKSLAGKECTVVFKNLPKSCNIGIIKIRSKHADKLVYVEGVIKKVTKIQWKIVSIKSECQNCGTMATTIQETRAIKLPFICRCGAKGKFKKIGQDVIDVQRIEIEELPELLESMQPSTHRVHVLIEASLAQPHITMKLVPGNRVRIIGNVIETPTYLRPATEEKALLFDYMIKSNNIEILSSEFENVVFTEDDIKKINEMAVDPNLSNNLVASVAPSIYGYDKIKLALLLQLFGGVNRTSSDGTKLRGNIHILLIGDPGSGKSQLLQRIKTIAPKGIYVAGKGASGVGLTAAVVKDEMLGGYALEAGALVLANNGIACIDELDKMGQDDRSYMHEALEQQQISVNKANIHMTLPANTTVLAAANPKMSRFDSSQDIHKQFDMPPTLLSRFDAIFPFIDNPERELDERLGMKVLGSRMQEKAVCPYDTALLRKYITHARKINPDLTEEVTKDMCAFYVEIRQKSARDASGQAISVAITPRQLEALIRLSEAAARMRLSNKIEPVDVAIAKQIILFYLDTMCSTGHGTYDMDKIASSINASKRSKLKVMRDIIKDLTDDVIGGLVNLSDVINKAEESSIPPEEAEEILALLRRAGDIIEPRSGLVKLV